MWWVPSGKQPSGLDEDGDDSVDLSRDLRWERYGPFTGVVAQQSLGEWYYGRDRAWATIEKGEARLEKNLERRNEAEDLQSVIPKGMRMDFTFRDPTFFFLSNHWDWMRPALWRSLVSTYCGSRVPPVLRPPVPPL